MATARAAAVMAAAVVCPLLLAYALISADMRSDLSQTKVRAAGGINGAVLVGWADLKHVTIPEGRIQMLGYMVYRSQQAHRKDAVTLVLMPQADHLLYWAKRGPNEMATIRLRPGNPVHYKDRSLVWVSGRLLRDERGSERGAALWLLSDALVRRAEQRDIARWFTP